MDCNCKKPCVKCRKDKKCPSPCGCAEPTFSIEAMPDDPSLLRFNINGKSVWYDFEPVVKNAETCTTLNVDVAHRTLEYHGECSDQTIHARELGSILHLADIGDVKEETIGDNGILNYRKDANCGEGCEGIANGWVSTNPVEVGGTSLDYILGSDSEGQLKSLMPPTDTTTFSYLAWAAQDKAMWKKPTIVSVAPQDSDGNKYALYLDPNSGEIVVVKESA